MHKALSLLRHHLVDGILNLLATLALVVVLDGHNGIKALSRLESQPQRLKEKLAKTILHLLVP